MKAIIPQVEPKFKYQIHVDVKCIRWQRLRARCVVKIGQIGFDALIVRAQGGCPAVAVPSRFIALLTPEMQAAITTAVLGAWREGGER